MERDSATALPIFAIKLVVLGDADCGKTAFLSALFQGLGASSLTDDVFEIARRDRRYTITVLEDELPTNLSRNESAVILFCFDIGNRDSLQVARRYWYPRVVQSLPADADDIPTMLLGLKRDRRSDASLHPIDIHEALKIAQELRIATYAECSVKNGELVKQVAEDFLQMIRSAADAWQSAETYSYCIVS